MSRWYAIPPENYLEMMRDWKTHMIIAPHLLNSKTYQDFYITNAENLHCLLDNGLWEGYVVSNSKLLKMADYCLAEEIIAPDHVSGAITAGRTKRFIEYLKQNGQRNNFKIHGAVHGSKFSEARKCLLELVKFGVDIISMPKMLGQKWRLCFAEYIQEKHPEIPVHYLGYYKEELPLLEKTNNLVRSFDTSVPFKPRYGEKFDLHLPYTLRNRIIISSRVSKWKKLYK